MAQLRLAGKEPDCQLLDRVKAVGSAAIPPLIEMATDESLHNAGPDSAEVWAPLHAIQLLGELEAAEAVEPPLLLLSLEDDWLDTLLPEALGRIGRPAFDPLRALLFDTSRDTWTRSHAGNGLAEIAQSHPKLRDEVVATLVSFLDQTDARESDRAELNAFVTCDLLGLKAVEARAIASKFP
ncbi:MAG: hypothetical protein HY332_24915 [Chloroflexi bacterium]|nr:hypothetical protein [Chloroflexota bacterium]